MSNVGLRAATEAVAARSASATTLADIAWASQRYATEVTSEHAVRARRTADAWCAAFLSDKTPEAAPITHEVLNQASNGLAATAVAEAIDQIAARHRLFHWHLEFPEVFVVREQEPAPTPTGWTGGFDAILGNPPWDQVQLHPNEFFASSAPAISEASTMAKRDRLIAALKNEQPSLHAAYERAKRDNDAMKHLLHASGGYPLTAFGRLNTYSLEARRILWRL